MPADDEGFCDLTRLKRMRQKLDKAGDCDESPAMIHARRQWDE
jgi:hypothetical protein